MMDQFKVLSLCGQRYIQECITFRRRQVWRLVKKLPS